MRMTRHAGLMIVYVLIGGFVAAAGVRAAQQPDSSTRPDFSGRWTLNRELSEDGVAKLQRLHGGEGGGHGPARHGGAGSGGAQGAAMHDVRDVLVRAPEWLTVAQHGEQVVLTENDGRVRTLVANGQKEQINGREVRTKWDDTRLVSETSFDIATVRETYERSASTSQLIVTTGMDMGGQIVNIRRVYDAAAQR